MATDYVVHHLDRVASTQDEARTRFAGVPCLVTATEQASGRGRAGASWLNADRSIAASLALTLEWPHEQFPLLTLVGGLAARNLFGDSFRLKWPNDVVTPDGAKVAGLLTEHIDEVVIIGLGANLYWADPPDGAAAVMASDPGPEQPRALAGQWVEEMLEAVAAGPADWGLAEYRACSATLGTMVTWDDGGPAVAVDVADDGGLVVESNGNRQVLRSGQVRTVRAATLTD